MTAETVDFPLDRIVELLDQVELAEGHHTDGRKACAMDLLGMAIEGEWKDTLHCVHPVLSGAVHKINDHRDTTPDDRRSLVVDAGPLLVGSADKPAVWACLVRHKAGLTAAGLVAALAGTPETDLSYANLRSANLRSANLRSANLSYANLSYANLRSANLRSADLSYANLSYANLSYANLSYANLSSANLRSADLSSARYTQLTIWPDGFDPKTTSAIEVDSLGQQAKS